MDHIAPPSDNDPFSRLPQEIPELTPSQFKKFAEMIHREAGITMKESKITLLSNRLRKRLRALSMSDFDAYFDFINSGKPETSSELIHFLEVVTTNESYFWRTTNNYDLLREDLLPVILKRYRGETLKIWSAGCSTGEEAYNLAIELVESMKRYGVFSFQIIASDISKRVVEFARAGKYQGRKIEKVPAAILQRYFNPDPQEPGSYVVRSDIKKRIEFRAENIYQASVGPVHLIFCRNVMIYFNRQDQETLAHHFYSQLLPGGYLIIGHSESLHLLNTPFQSIHCSSGVAYTRGDS